MDNLGQIGPAVDVAEAAELTGLSKKALRSRIERGTLPAIKRDGKRVIPVAELRRQGLLVPAEASGEVGEGQPPAPTPPLRGIPSDLLDRLERQAEELGRLRALTEEAESLRVKAAKADSLEAQLAAEQESRERLETEIARLRLETERRPRGLRRLFSRSTPSEADPDPNP